MAGAAVLERLILTSIPASIQGLTLSAQMLAAVQQFVAQGDRHRQAWWQMVDAGPTT